MNKINVLQFEGGKVGLATEGLSIKVNGKEPIVITETEAESLNEARGEQNA